MSKSQRNTNHRTKTLVTGKRGSISLKQRVGQIKPSERSDSSAAQRNSATYTSLEIATSKYEVTPVDPAASEIVLDVGVGQHADVNTFLDELPKCVRLAVMKPALLKDETFEAYFGLMRLLAAELQPRTMTRWLLLKSLTDYTWEIERYRRAERHIITNVEVQSRYSLIQRRLDERGIKRWEQDLPELWTCNIQVLARHMGVDDTTVDDGPTIGESFVIRIPELERMARLRTNAELRRDQIFQQLEESRDHKTAERLRAAVHKLETNSIKSESTDVSLVPVDKSKKP